MDELLDPMKNPVTYAAPFFVLTILVELAALRWLDHDDNLTGYALKDARTSISMGIVSLVFLTAFKLVSFVGFVAVSTYLAPWHLPTDTWWYWVLVVLGVDLGYYAHHRFSHRVRIAWAGHQAHHSSDFMNFGTALRQKWNPWFEFFFWLPLPLLGFAPWTLYVAFGLNLIYQFFTHTEIVDRLPRPVEWVMNTPSHHRVHHGSDPEYLDKNYGGILIVWDRLFGTFAPERHRPRYGLTTPVTTFNLLELQYGHYREIWQDARAATRWRDKVGYVVGPPGWAPTDPATPSAPAAPGPAPAVPELP
ncbi:MULTISPECIES: sterol desaturase family protein [unclassified Nocardioides]|uniref:sterol desaturase family protein n=1 Tax=unclassified Nocardioides TaxID=2615069 RepID=UPI0024059E52|nr:MULTISPECIES: sterol desaturase family protein [unclassified Nocardioides]MDF9715089.1 sterol desaturase family protein [Nocardioides sp. ChNu-99]